AEIVSDMKSNMSFLAPLLSGVVVGLASMITAILIKLDLSQLGSEGVPGSLSGLVGPGGIFQIADLIPPYFLQIIIGIYLIQIIFILTRTLVVIDSGEDGVQKTFKTGSNLSAGMIFYFVTSLLATIALFVLVSIVLGGAV
ncbi:MAG: hypothetical protein KKC19_01545, partial [Nanoarchaeota archaeon]|nr:hypothetical protein [Nanoarchaeota archaeon]